MTLFLAAFIPGYKADIKPETFNGETHERFFSSKEADVPAVWDLTIGRVCAFAEAAL